MLVSRIVLLATTVAAAVVRRDASKVIADLQAVQANFINFESAIANYTGGDGLGPYIPSLHAAKVLDDSLQSAASDAQAAGKWSEADSQTVLDYLTNTIEPTVAASMLVLHLKKALFVAGGLTQTVHDNLVALKKDAIILGVWLIVDNGSKSSATQAIVDKIAADFQQEIDEFSS